MGKTLVIAEKPSVAGDLSRALGKFTKNKDFYENDDYVVTSAVGHLVELCLPGEMDKKRGKWSFANLPIIPEHFDLKPIEKNETRYKLLKKLLNRKDIDDVINACDAGREGELIFHYIMELTGSKKSTSRLWLQSMTSEAIRKGFENLRDGVEMTPLADAAVCRSESDWLVGINGTRAMTAFNSKGGGFQLTPVGRVQTPTLAILAEREERIRAFVPKPYFEVFGDFGVAAGQYRGRWLDQKFKKSDTDDQLKAERIWTEDEANALKAKCEGKPGEITEEKKPTSQAAPLLYDLTTLQREANGRFGLPAKRTLQIAQALYERHKVLTYPRTDSRYLPDDYVDNVKENFGKFQNQDLAAHAKKALKEGWVTGGNKRVFNTSKVSDHHAIIPTGAAPKTLDDMELKVFDMVARRFIAVFYPSAQFEVTTRFTHVEKEAFRTDGKVITDPGWLAVYGKSAVTADDDTLVPVAKGEGAKTEAIEVKRSETRPPARYNEATLLSAMEGAGKLVEDEELRAAMSQRGLGTPATRAQIIEGLIYDGYLIRQGREIITTAKGLSLITLLKGIGVESLTSPELTGDWEHKLKEMESGKMDRASFMAEIRRFTEEIVGKAKDYSGEAGDVAGNFHDLEARDPRTGETVHFKESFKAYEAPSGTLIWKTMAGRELERAEIITLLEQGQVGPLEGFRSKMGRPFAAVVKLDDDNKQSFDFGDDKIEQVDFSQAPVLGPCPVCKAGTVHDTPNAYMCTNTPEKKCTFRMGKTILQREILVDQAKKLIETGKTDLLPRFISKKGRPFSAFLKLEEGKVGFEFEERKKKPAAVKKKPAPAA
jgi:DNA topoisomerase-3